MRSASAIALAVAVAAGAMVSLQSYVNGRLGGVLGSAQTAAAVSNTVGLVALVALVVITGAHRRAWRTVRAAGSGALRTWFFVGGICGALLVAVNTAGAPEIGVALLTVALVCGQATGSLAADAAGISPAGHQPVTVPRIAGIALAIAAVVVGSLGASVDPQPLILALAVLAGAASALQQSANGRLVQATREPLVAGAVNFAVGLVVLVAVALVATGLEPPRGYGGSPVLWLGGLLGAFVATAGAVVVRTLGVLRLALALTAGQSAGALAIDALAPAKGELIGAGTIIGVLLAVAAVAVSSLRRRSGGVDSGLAPEPEAPAGAEQSRGSSVVR